MEAPQGASASGVQYYMVNDERNQQRKSYRVNAVTAGDYNDDSRYAEWQQVNGAVVPCRVSAAANLSELFSAYSITLDADRASSAATNHALSLAATDLEYEVTRVKSPVLGRDLNPFGRGDGTYYCNGGNTAGGSLAIAGAKPWFIGDSALGYGNSVNNEGDGSRPGYCQQVALVLGRCDITAPPEDANSCCNATNPEVWLSIWGGWKEYRDAGCGLGIPDQGSGCYRMGLKWMKECLLCDEIYEGCGNGNGGPCSQPADGGGESDGGNGVIVPVLASDLGETAPGAALNGWAALRIRTSQAMNACGPACNVPHFSELINGRANDPWLAKLLRAGDGTLPCRGASPAKVLGSIKKLISWICRYFKISGKDCNRLLSWLNKAAKAADWWNAICSCYSDIDTAYGKFTDLEFKRMVCRGIIMTNAEGTRNPDCLDELEELETGSNYHDPSICDKLSSGDLSFMFDCCGVKGELALQAVAVGLQSCEKLFKMLLSLLSKGVL